MPPIRVNGVELHYEEAGAGAETLVFAHGLLCSGLMFRHQLQALSGRYRCIAFDFRGHGQSEIAAGGYDMDTLCQDTVAVVRALGAAPCHFLGHSMGGFVGMTMALAYPELVRSLVLINTTADAETWSNVVKYRALSVLARMFGLPAAVAPVMKTMFAPDFLRDPARAAERQEWRRRLIGNDVRGITRAVGGVVRRVSIHERLDRITVPALIIGGAADVATRPLHSRRMQARLPRAELHILAGVGHCATIEAPDVVSILVQSFVSATGAPPEDEGSSAAQ